MAVGPGRLPFPRHFGRDRNPVSFAQQMEVSEDLIARHDDVLSRGAGVALILPVYAPDHMPEDGPAIRAMSTDMRDMQDRTGVLFTQDGHRTDTVALAAELGLLSPRAALSHSVDLSSADFKALTDTGASIIHNPSAIMSILGRCPAPELIEAGKKADIVFLDGRRAHLWPPVMALNRITHFANAADVSTVIVSGKLLLDDSKPVLVSPDDILSEAEAEASRVFAASGHDGNRQEGS
jgi:hypothetical protein